MVSEEKNQEMSVNEILSSIKEVISNEKVSKNIDDEDEILELTDVVSGEDDSILLDDVIDPDDLVKKQNANENLTDDIKKNLHLDESGFLSDLSIDNIIKETIKETLNEWFAKNLKPIVEESVKEEVAKLFKKRN
jgi:cell pole-organizing protein PopZ